MFEMSNRNEAAATSVASTIHAHPGKGKDSSVETFDFTD